MPARRLRDGQEALKRIPKRPKSTPKAPRRRPRGRPNHVPGTLSGNMIPHSRPGKGSRHFKMARDGPKMVQDVKGGTRAPKMAQDSCQDASTRGAGPRPQNSSPDPPWGDRGALGLPSGALRASGRLQRPPGREPDQPRQPASAPTRANMASRRAQRPPTRPKRPPRGLPRGPQKAKNVVFHMFFFDVFCLLSFSAFRRSKTAQEAPKRAPSRPKKTHRSPKGLPRGP